MKERWIGRHRGGRKSKAESNPGEKVKYRVSVDEVDGDTTGKHVMCVTVNSGIGPRDALRLVAAGAGKEVA